MLKNLLYKVSMGNILHDSNSYQRDLVRLADQNPNIGKEYEK